MQSITDQMTIVYCFVDDSLKAHPGQVQWRTSSNACPAFTDAEFLTIALMQAGFGCASLKQTYRLLAHNGADWFPTLPSYKQWLARLHKLRRGLHPIYQTAVQASSAGTMT